jgi:uncharacterized protein YeaO (DUF488 family)
MPPKGESLFTEEDITRSLMAVIAWSGNVRAAHRALTAESHNCPAEGTLREWTKEKYAARYNEMREKYTDQMEASLAHDFRDAARQAVELQLLAIQKAKDKLHTDNDPSRTAANAATVADKMTGKLLAITGRPTSIREDRNVDQLLRSLTAMGVLQPPPEPPEITEAVPE